MQTNQNTTTGNLPEKKFRAGPIAATIWKNDSLKEGKPVTYRTVSIGRSYKDKNGQWQHTSSMRVSDIPRAALVLEEAYKYIVMNSNGLMNDSKYGTEEEPVLA